MDLSNELISQFVKITNDSSNQQKSKESIVYGTTIEYENRMYVKIDGSDLLTPIETTADIQAGERVTIMIKDHSATVTGNITSPSANVGTVDKVVTEKTDGMVEEIEGKVAAEVQILDAEIAYIGTLVNGNLTSDNILSFHITADKVTMDDAFISDAMIANVSAGKITSGSINTSLVNVQSEDGSLIINGSTQQFKDSDGNVRIQIGKDSSGDFTFALYGADGQGQLINQNGITSSAVSDGLIVDKMVSDNAAISGGKLDISSVITEINSDNSTTIKSNKIYLDEKGQSLEVAFNSLQTQVDNIQDITIDGDLTAIIEQVQSNMTQIEVNKQGIQTLVAEDTVIKEQISTLDGEIVEVNETLTTKYSTLQQDVSGFKTTVADTYATKQSVTDLNTNLTTNYSTTSTMNSAINQSAKDITSSVSSTYATKSSLGTLETRVSSAEQKITDSAIESTVTSSTSWKNQTANIEGAQDAADSALSKANTNASSISTVSQTANKINWIVKSGTSSSNMTLTDKTYELISGNISLTADHIDLHGYVTANKGFSIDTQGNMTAQNGTFSGNITGSTFASANDIFNVLEDGTVETNYLSVNGNISSDTLDIGHIYNPKYPTALTERTTVYINASATSTVTDPKDFYNGAVFASFADMISIVPKNINGYRLDIYMQSNVTENVMLIDFYGGECLLHMQGYTIKGFLRCDGVSMLYRIYGNTSASTGTSTHGKIMPNSGSYHYSYYYDISCTYGMFFIYDVELYPTTTQTANTGGIYFGGGARGYVGRLYLMGGSGGLRYAIRAYEVSTVYVASSSGAANNAAFCANSGSTIALNPTSQIGTTATSPTYSAENSEIRSTGVTFSSTGNSGSNTGGGATSTTVTKTIQATSADTYRSTVYNNWKGDGTVRQGDYGYGDCQGCWFFGSALYDAMNAGTLTKVVIRIKRQSGGTSAAVTHTLKYHNYASKPSGAPSYGGTLTTFSCATGSTVDITITSATTLATLKKYKGLGLSIGSTSSPYSVCSGSCTVFVTYKT